MLIKAVENIYYIRQIPEVREVIQKHFSAIQGITKVAVNIRVLNRVIAYVFIDKKVLTQRKRNMVYPADVGLKFRDSKINATRFPRFWLEEMKAEILAEKEVCRQFPQLKIEWVTLLYNAATNSITPIG